MGWSRVGVMAVAAGSGPDASSTHPVVAYGAVVQGDQPTALTLITGSPEGRILWQFVDDKGGDVRPPGPAAALHAQPPDAG